LLITKYKPGDAEKVDRETLRRQREDSKRAIMEQPLSIWVRTKNKTKYNRYVDSSIQDYLV
jgi:hypothetical protein